MPACSWRISCSHLIRRNKSGNYSLKFLSFTTVPAFHKIQTAQTIQTVQMALTHDLHSLPFLSHFSLFPAFLAARRGLPSLTPPPASLAPLGMMPRGLRRLALLGACDRTSSPASQVLVLPLSVMRIYLFPSPLSLIPSPFSLQFWLPGEDSNLETRLQRPMCYHYTTGHYSAGLRTSILDYPSSYCRGSIYRT